MCVCTRGCVLFLDESIDVVLSSVLIVGHLKHTRHTKQRLVSVSVADHLDTHRGKTLLNKLGVAKCLVILQMPRELSEGEIVRIMSFSATTCYQGAIAQTQDKGLSQDYSSYPG